MSLHLGGAAPLLAVDQFYTLTAKMEGYSLIPLFKGILFCTYN